MISAVPAERAVGIGSNFTASELRQNIPIHAYMWIRNFIIATGQWPRMTADGQLLDEKGHVCSQSNKPPAPAREYYKGEQYQVVVPVKDDAGKPTLDDDGLKVEKVVKRRRLMDGPPVAISVKEQLAQLDKAIDKVLPSLKSMEINHQSSDTTKLSNEEIKALKSGEIRNRIAELETIIEKGEVDVPRETSEEESRPSPEEEPEPDQYEEPEIPEWEQGAPDSVLCDKAATRKFGWERGEPPDPYPPG